MPDETGKLSLSDRALIQKWLADRAPSKRCPVCQSSDWGFPEYLTNIPVSTATSIFGTGASYQAVLAHCRQCGLFMAFSAYVLGIKGPAPREEEKASDVP